MFTGGESWVRLIRGNVTHARISRFPAPPMNSSTSTRVAPTCAPKVDAPELDWLLEISALATLPKGPPQVNHQAERLARMMIAALEHFDSLLGALLVPGRNLRLVHRSDHAQARIAEEVLNRLQGRLLNHIRRHQRPMLLNNGSVDSASQTIWGLLVVPVPAEGTAPDGALVVFRSTADPEFSALQLSVARHLGRYISSVLETELDPATGLYTRAGIQRHVRSLNCPPESLPSTHAVICIDIDRLRIVNKVNGFEGGDALIARFAGLMREPPVPEAAAAARISGNEFVLVLPNVDEAVAERTARALQQMTSRLTVEGASAHQPVSLSCGVAKFGHPADFQRGLVLAELACQTAKDRGRNRVEVYQDNDVSMIRCDAEIVASQQLRDALRENRLTLFAQRIIPLNRRDDLGGYELLLRSLDQPHENHAPATLLAAALRSDLAPDLDLWVIERALESIRLSGLPPSLIMFEITETVALLSLAKAVKFMQELRAIGCRFALDDFGAGSNSLKNLTNLPVDRVKIDGSFVSDILTNHQSAAMVRAIVSLGRDLGITTVAEYAENDRIIERLRQLGVEYAQGYGVEKPRPVSEVFAELSARQSMRNSTSRSKT